MSYDDERDDLLHTARTELRKDLIELRTDSASRRRKRSSQIKEDFDEFEEEFTRKYRDSLTPHQIKLYKGEFQTALLKLHVGSLDDPDAEPLHPHRFNDDEIEAVRELDKYRAFDVSDPSRIQEKIESKDREIYEFVVMDVTDQIENRNFIFNSKENEIKKPIMAYLGKRYDELQELAEEGVIEYISEHGLPDVIKSIEEAVDASLNAQQTKEAIQSEVRDVMEEFTTDIMAGFHGQEEALLAELSSIQADLNSGQRDPSELANQLDSIGKKIDDLEAQRGTELEDINSTLERLESLNRDIEEDIETVKTKQIEVKDVEDEVKQTTKANKSKKLLENTREELEETREKLQAKIEHVHRKQQEEETSVERLEGKYKTISQQLENMKKSVKPAEETPNEERLHAEDARLFELDYIGRVKSSLKNTNSILLPNGETFNIPRGYWNNNTHISVKDQRDQIDSLDLESADLSQYPLGRYLRATLTDSGYLNSNDKLVIEAKVLCHLEAFATNGFDTIQAGMPDLVATIEETFERVGNLNVPHIIAAASPTGWDDDVIEKVQRRTHSRTRFGEDVSIYLIDLQTDEIYFDQADDVLVANKNILEREEMEERIAACKRSLRSREIEPTKDALLLKNVVNQTEYEASIVRQAFEDLDKAGDGRLHQTQSGLALDFKQK